MRAADTVERVSEIGVRADEGIVECLAQLVAERGDVLDASDRTDDKTQQRTKTRRCR